MPTSVDLTHADPTDPPRRHLALRVVERPTGQRRLHRLHRRVERDSVPGEDVLAAGARLLGLAIEHDPPRLDRLPRADRLAVVANHPVGLVDGSFRTARGRRVRPACKVVAHGLPARAPVTADRLRQSHVVAVCPAGGIATTPSPVARTAVDDRRTPFTARLVQAAAAPVLPGHFAGQGSRHLRLASRLSQTLHTAPLLHETRNKIGATVVVGIGEVVPFTPLAHLRDRQALAGHLVAITHALPLRRSSRRRSDRNAPPDARRRLPSRCRDTGAGHERGLFRCY